MRLKLLPLIMLVLLPSPAFSRVDFGGGMSYFSVKTYARDARGYSCQTLLQTTLAEATLACAEGPLDLRLTGGLSDWDASGEFTGSDLPAVDIENIALWAWQQQWSLEADCRVWGGWSLGMSYTDHALRHYQFSRTYLQYRDQVLDLRIHYAVLQSKDLQVILMAAYSPLDRIEVFQDTGQDPAYIGIQSYDSAGTGTRWHGQAQMQYRDSAGWGLNFIYDAGFADFPQPRNLSEFSLRFGSLSGILSIFF